MIRIEPRIRATEVIEQTCAVGIPARSSSFASAAPQRVLVPQVEVRIAPETPSAFIRSAMLLPIASLLFTTLARPDVLGPTCCRTCRETCR
jgi:hypothetical protein